MIQLSLKSLVAPAALAAALLALLWLGPAGTPSSGAAESSAGRACAHADATPQQATKAQLRRAMKCLVARERAKRDRPAVRARRPLQKIAQRHSRKMVKTDCLAHRCPGEASLERRIETSGYVGPGDRYGYGEVTGCGPTPRTMLEQWLAHRAHRRNLLKRSFRHIGVGAVKGAPKSVRQCQGGLHATYTVLLAWRRG